MGVRLLCNEANKVGGKSVAVGKPTAGCLCACAGMGTPGNPIQLLLGSIVCVIFDYRKKKRQKSRHGGGPQAVA